MNNTNKRIKGFTMVELLCAIVILGLLSVLGIKSLSGMMDKAKDTKNLQQDKTLTMAAESYVQANRSKLPRMVGEKKIIPISDLKDAKFLKEDIKNAKGESCMAKSYVVVFKSSKSEYEYTTYLVCGNEDPPTDKETKPTIKIDFVDSDGGTITNLTNINKIKKSKLNVEITAGKLSGKSISIYSYNISIIVNGKEAYNSGSISANKKNTVKVSKLVSDYVDISTNTNNTTLVVKVTARSVDGGVSTKSETVGFLDKKDPEGCDSVDGQAPASGPNQWINIYSTQKYRNITIHCDDGDGSGCVRDIFTGTWNKQKQAEMDKIVLLDNAGNETTCNVRAYVDLDAPDVKFSKTSTDNKKIFSSDFTIRENGKVGYNGYYNYERLYNDEWVNNNVYGSGLNFNIELTDNIGLVSWNFKTNAGNIWTSPTVGNFSGLSTSNPDASSGGTFNASDHKKSVSIKLSLKAQGRRHGLLTVTDIAGNRTEIEIFANIDLTDPECTTSVQYSSGASLPASGWLKNGGWATVSSSCDDHGQSGCNAEAQLGRSHKYDDDVETTKAGSINVGNSGTFFDNAGNEGSCPANKTVNIDTKPPECTVTAKDYDGRSYDGSKWTKSATVSSTCNDVLRNDVRSGCSNSDTYTYSKTNTSDGEYTNATSKGLGSTIVYKDVAGNEITCSSQKIKIDNTPPTVDFDMYKSSSRHSTNYNIAFSGGADNWSNTNVQTIPSATDNHSTSSQMKFTYDQRGPREKTETANERTIGYDGKNEIRWKACDEANNCSDYTAWTKVWIDRIDPTCTLNGNSSTGSWYGPGDELWIEYKCSDTGGSGCESTYVDYSHEVSRGNSWDNGSGGGNSSFYGEGWQIYGAGKGDDVVDNAGNTSVCSGVNFKIDVREPSIEGLVANSWTNYTNDDYWDTTHGATRKAVQYYLGSVNSFYDRHSAIQVWVEDGGSGIGDWDDWVIHNKWTYDNDNERVCVGAKDKVGNYTNDDLCACFCSGDSFQSRTSPSDSTLTWYYNGKAYNISDSRWYYRYPYRSDPSSSNPKKLISDPTAQYSLSWDDCEDC